MAALKAARPELSFAGVGGVNMKAQGLDCWRDAETLNVMGLLEVLKHIPFFKRVLDELVERVLRSGIKVFVAIDFPDFNIRLAKRLKKHGVTIIYYVCPQVWAWRKSRIGQIEAIVDVLMPLFPFEPKYFDHSKLKVEFVGHPLMDEVAVLPPLPTPAEGEGALAVMPGSRHSEIKHHMPVLVPTILAALERYPKLSVHVPCAQTLTTEQLWSYFSETERQRCEGRLWIHEPGDSHGVLERCHAALIASGTSILQGVMSNRPLVLFYRLDGLSFWIGKKLIDLKHVGLSNLIAEKEINRELLQDDMNEASLMAEIEKLMWNGSERSRMLEDFEMVQQRLGQPGASERAAQVVLDNLP